MNGDINRHIRCSENITSFLNIISFFKFMYLSLKSLHVYVRSKNYNYISFCVLFQNKHKK